MNNNRYIHIGYRCCDDSMKRITTIPVGFSIIMLEGRMYNYEMLQEARQVVSFGEKSAIVQDTYGQHWYHRTTKVRDMEAYETYEPIPEYIVSENYEEGRVPGMMIYPYIRVDHSRKFFEVHENLAVWRDENAFIQSFMELNKKNIQNF